jgi:hypothetical protein
LQTTPESRLRKANPFIVDNDSIACSLGFGFRFIIAKGLPSFVQHSSHFNGLIQDTHVGSYTQVRIAGDSTVKPWRRLSGRKALQSAVNQPLGICDVSGSLFLIFQVFLS